MNLKTPATVFFVFWTDSILKTELYENDGVVLQHKLKMASEYCIFKLILRPSVDGKPLMLWIVPKTHSSLPKMDYSARNVLRQLCDSHHVATFTLSNLIYKACLLSHSHSLSCTAAALGGVYSTYRKYKGRAFRSRLKILQPYPVTQENSQRFKP